MQVLYTRKLVRQTDRYFIDRKKVITDLFVIEMKEIYVHVYTRLESPITHFFIRLDDGDLSAQVCIIVIGG